MPVDLLGFEIERKHNLAIVGSDGLLHKCLVEDIGDSEGVSGVLFIHKITDCPCSPYTRVFNPHEVSVIIPKEF